MEGITWLHLSDWHQKGQEFNRKVVRDALIKDIEKRSKIDSALTNLDFFVFSGDVTHGGRREEYETAIKEFFNPVLNVAGLRPDQLIVVPGNHDLEWSALDLLPNDLLDKFDSSEQVSEWLTDGRKRRALLEPMANYSQFVNVYIGKNSFYEPAYGFTKTFEIRGQKICIVGLNSAWLSGQNKEAKRGKTLVNDYGHLILGEAQVYDLLQSDAFKNADLRIAVMHHPFDWLIEFDKQVLRDQLRKNFHFILHGHEHQPQVRIESGTGGDCIIVPAGPSYDRREPDVSRCSNAYNYVSLDFKSNKCKVYLRRYEDRQGWIKDIGTTGENTPGYWQIGLNKNLRKKKNNSKASSSKKTLNTRLENIIQLYLVTCFERDQFAKLDQAGETDPDRTTLLKQIFVDLEVKRFGDIQPRGIERQILPLEEHQGVSTDTRINDEQKVFSVMNTILQEIYSRIVFIGGPGQGKSTLSQFLAQTHRAHLLGKNVDDNSSNNRIDKEFEVKKSRIPFRIILKYFAQWLIDEPRLDTLEMYLAEQVERDTAQKVSTNDIQEMLQSRPTLIIFDGLDEVIEPELRDKLIGKISEFLSRTDLMAADMQVIATSRPTGYTGQFNPRDFWHLELQPLSDKKVQEYTKKWVDVKVSGDEEQKRVLDTLKECQQEEHTKLLLTTPLQVTIVLLITKDGGRPPAQREALFHEYWNTIFRREKAKAKGVIRTEESLLFELHAYLGYLLHQRAEKENVRSLLPENEFREAVKKFLRQKDSHSLPETVNQRALQMVKEAEERLVLLVLQRKVESGKHRNLGYYVI